MRRIIERQNDAHFWRRRAVTVDTPGPEFYAALKEFLEER